MNVKIKGILDIQKNRTVVTLCPASPVNLLEMLGFVLLTFLILLFAGSKMGVGTIALLVTLAVSAIWVFVLVNVFTKFTKKGQETYMDLADVLIRILDLEEIFREKRTGDSDCD